MDSEDDFDSYRGTDTSVSKSGSDSFYLSTSEKEIDDDIDRDLSRVRVWHDAPSTFVSPALSRFP